MMDFFNFFGSILGYLLWWLYNIFRNYGVAILFFTIIVKAVLFPFSLKQQKSMAAQSKLSAKQQELQKKYGNNKQKYSEELQKLYDKEGVSPGAGCLTSLLPMPIMLGIFYSVVYPLSNTLHIAKETVQLATDYISKIPGVNFAGQYVELDLVRNFSLLRDKLTMFSSADLAKIDLFSDGFNFLGLNLLETPSDNFLSPLLIIPILSLVFSFATQFYMTRTQKKMGQAQQQGCMKVMMYALPLLSVYWAYSMPAAVGFYWVISSLVGLAQSVITNTFFSTHHMIAKSEAQRAVTLELTESKIRPLPVTTQKQIADKIEAGTRTQSIKQSKNANKKQNTQKKPNKKTGNSPNQDQYMGKKK